MIFNKPAFLALSALMLSSLTAGADESLNTCNLDIEGATLLMSRDAIATEWSSRGYVKTPPPRRARSRQDPANSLSFQTADGRANDRYISSLKWAATTTPALNDGQSTYLITTTYQPPADAAGLAAYKQFVRDKITSWCEWAAPIVETQEGGGPGRAKLICGKVLAGDFYTTSNGIATYHQYAAATQTWKGCNWSISSDTDGRLGVTLTGPVDLTK